jgi:hypothetical protein
MLAPAAGVLARTGAAEVREGPRGGPCFTISPREEREGTPDFHAVTVSDGQRLLWKMTMPPERTFPLSFSMCVPYGGQVASLPRTQAAGAGSGQDLLPAHRRPSRQGPRHGPGLRSALLPGEAARRQRRGAPDLG